MRELLPSVLLIGIVLAVPIVPFLLFESDMEEWAQRWSEGGASKMQTSGLVVAVLSTDVFLPIPSSMISTAAGWQLGTWLGTLASWLGMTIGAALGFVLARAFGRRFALWFSRGKDLDRMKLATDRYGAVALVLCRGVPVLAEASVLLVGIHRLPWRKFLPAVLLSNLGIAAAYSAFGQFAKAHGWFPMALGVSIALPVIMAAIMRRWLPRAETHDDENEQANVSDD